MIGSEDGNPPRRYRKKRRTREKEQTEERQKRQGKRETMLSSEAADCEVDLSSTLPGRHEKERIEETEE